MPRKKSAPPKPYFFVSYSTREPHVKLLIECPRTVFAPHFEIKLTPSALKSGASQRDQITKLIQDCTLAVVALDGLRPNIVFEYGILHGKNKPVMLFKEAEAKVNIPGFFRDSATLGVGPTPLELDTHFSR